MPNLFKIKPRTRQVSRFQDAVVPFGKFSDVDIVQCHFDTKIRLIQ